MNKLHLPTLALSMLVSVGLWLYVFNLRTNPTRTQTVTLNLVPSSLDSKRFIIADAPDTVSASIAGTPEQIASIQSQPRSAYIDLRNAQPGTRAYPVSVFPVQLRELLVNEGLTAQIKIEKLETKVLEVEVQLAGNRPVSGYKVDIFPPRLRSLGSRDALQKVTRLIAKVERIEDATETDGVEAEVMPVDSEGRPMTKAAVNDLGDPIEYTPELLAKPAKVRVRLSVKPAIPNPTP